MKLLQLNFEKGWRGGERQTLLCMQAFRQRGHEVSLLARRGGELARRAKEQGFPVHEFAGPFQACRFLAGQGRHFDILHAQTAGTLTWLALLKPLLGRRPLVFTRRTAFPLHAAKATRTRWKWQRADALVAISQAAAAEPERLGLHPLLIPSAVLPRPLNEALLDEFAREHVPQGKRVIATVAALTAEKDPLTMIQAVHLLRQKRDDFVFLHIGAGGDSEQAARERVATLGLEDTYRFTGFHSGIDDLYRLMDVFVSSSLHEALGTSVLDAFQYGVPVVATRAGGLVHSLADGRGLLCPVGDALALADAVDRVLSDAALRAGMVERARAWVQREHDVDVMAGRYLDLYATLLEAHGTAGASY